MFTSIQKLWQSPTAAYRGKPFWSWNGKLEREELLRQLRILAEMGMGGAFLHSRTGLDTEYLGDEWFELINACADQAAALGIEAWLYDEDRWPSGSAGGKATEDPQYRMKYLRLSQYAADAEIEWPDPTHFVAAFAAEVKGLHLSTYRRLRHGEKASDGNSVLVFAWETMAAHSFYNGNAYLDTMNAEATEHFMQITHDAYAERCGDRIGKAIKGIFTDEPHRGFVLCDVHGQPGPVNTRFILPWTLSLPEAFAAAFDCDLIERLPELFLQKDGRPHAKIKWQYMELTQRLFLENWAKPLQLRCQKLGMILTGHALHEDSLAAQAVPCGSMMRYYEYLDYPGVDILGNNNRNYWVVKQLASVSRQLDRPWMMSELYGCSGWDLCLDGHKRIGDWQALLGINLRCHHLSWYSMAGESKRDYPASISFQSAWYREYAAVETYFSRLHVLLMAGKPLCDVLVLNQVESLWTRIHLEWATWLSAKDEEILKLEAIYQDVFTWLMRAAIDFDYGDEDHLARFGVVNAERTTLEVGAMAYKVVVVAGMETMRGSTLELLKRFQQAGGTVVFAGDPPQLVDVEPSPAVRSLQQACSTVELEAHALVNAVRAASPAAQAFSLATESDALLCQVRQDGDKRIAVILNTSETDAIEAVELRSRSRGPVTALDCLTGECCLVESREEAGFTLWQTRFDPLQERVFVIGETVSDAKPVVTAAKPKCTHALQGPFRYRMDEPNIAVLDFAEFCLGDSDDWHSALEVLKIEKHICTELNIPLRAGDMVQPWARKAAGKTATHVSKSAKLRLRFSFKSDVATVPNDLFMLIEQPQLFTIQLNGKHIETPAQSDWFIDPCFRKIPLPGQDLTRDGSLNTIELESTFTSGFDLEAIYLIGSFAVSLEEQGVRLTEKPEKLELGDITQQGFPFYTGRVKYEVPAGNAKYLQVETAQAAAVVFRQPDAEATSISMPWGPFRQPTEGLCDDNGNLIVELILTRRNTFGPLHLTPKQQAAIGPESFRSEGAQWSNDYQLFPAGLMSVHTDS